MQLATWDDRRSRTGLELPPYTIITPSVKKYINIHSCYFYINFSTQAHLLPTTPSTAATVSDHQPPTPTPNKALSTINNMFTPLKSSSTMSASSSNSSNQPPSGSTITQNSKKKIQDRKRKKELLKTQTSKIFKCKYTTDEEDMIVYEVENEIESNPKDKFAMMECYRNNPETLICAR
ncbi:hypothetical protein TNCV_942291 [Trichonephila clavipes]|nr:hypothetical protein TNCV_942291 [Trichonephila clavipes]